MHAREGLNILVVDDDVQCLGTLEDFLEGEGHRIATATRGEAALRIAQRCREENRALELSILDLHVPDMNGLETFERLTCFIPGIGAIFISGDLSSSAKSSIHAAGAFRTIGKPFGIAEMRQAIEDYREMLAYLRGEDSSRRAVPSGEPASREEDERRKRLGRGTVAGERDFS